MKYATQNIILKTVIALILTFSIFIHAQEPKALVNGDGKIDFGAYPANEKKEAVFTITNKGDAPLLIKNIRKTCGCAIVTSSKMEISPEEETTIKITMEPEGISGMYSKNVYIETNDPKQKFISLSFSGNALPAFIIKPQDKINLGRIKTNEAVLQEFVIEPSDKIYSLGELSISSELKHKSPLIKNENGSYTLKLALSPESYMGAFKCQIKIPIIAHGIWKPLEILLTGKVGYELVVTPARIQSYKIISPDVAEASFQIKILGLEKIDSKQLSIKPSENVEASIESGRSNTATCKIKIKSLKTVQFPLKLDVSYPEASACSVILEKSLIQTNR